MESINDIKGRNAKFLASPRLEKLKNDFEKNGGEWKEFKMSELFNSQNGNFDIQQKHIDNKGEFIVSSGLQNSGIIGKSSVQAKVFNKNTITIDMFGNPFYRDFNYKMVTHARVFSLSSENIKNRAVGLYITSVLGYLPLKYSYSNMAVWEKVKNEKIILPVINGSIAFNYMEDYIKELEIERIKELETYLKVSGLENYELTKEEKNAFEKMKGGLSFKKLMIKNILKWQSQKEIDVLNLKKLRINGNIKYPFYGQSTINNGIISYESLVENVLNNKQGKPTILVHSNNQNCIYLERLFI